MKNLFRHGSKDKSGVDKDDYESEYAVGQEIGRGGFAVVYNAHKKGQESNIDNIAVRICPLKLALTSHAPYIMTVETLRTKMESAKSMSGGKASKHMLQFIDYRITKKDLITMTELCTGGDLFDRICNNTSPEGHFSEDDARGAARNLCEVLSYVHEKGTIHRDVKPENLLYKRKDSPIPEIALTDFGCCLPYCKRDEFYEGGPLKSRSGYLAPEMIAGQKYNMLVDEWSAGITIYEMLTGRSPLISATPEELNKETLDRAIPYPQRYWKQHSPEAKDFVQRLLQKDPKQRMSVEQALEHPWLKMEPGQGRPLAHHSDSTESDGPDPTETLVGRKTKRTAATYALMGHLTGQAGIDGSESLDAVSILSGRMSSDHASRLQAMEERDSGYASMTSSEHAATDPPTGDAAPRRDQGSS